VQFGQTPARSGASRSPSVDRGVEGEENEGGAVHGCGREERAKRWTGGGRRPLWQLGGTGGEETGQGGQGSASHAGREWGSERGARAWQGQLGRPASAPGQRARAAVLWRDRGGRRGEGDSVRDRLIDGARWAMMGCGRE
jgi:hypothetical protein